MENLAAAGFNTQETMAAMPGLLDLAAASGESLATSSDIAASTLRGFGLEANQAGHVADVLAKNANATNAAVADTGEAMKYISPVAHSMGLSLEEVTAAIGEMANSGIKGSQAGTTLRSALTRLASPSNEAAGAMASIGFNAFDSQGKLKSLSTIVGEYSKALEGKTEQQKQDLTATIFGQEAMSGMLVLMQGGKKGLDDLTNSYKASDGAAKDMATTMQDNAKSAIEQMTGSIETAAIKLEEAAAPAITQIANEVQDMANRFADLPEPMQESIIKTALFAAAIGPIAKTIGTVTSGIGGLIKFGGMLGNALGLIGTGAEAGEAALAGFSVAGGLAAGAASALVVGVAGAITYNELLSKSVDTSTDDLNIWERAVNTLTGGVVKSKAELQKAGLVYKDFGEGVSDSFKDGIEKATKQYHDFEMTLTGENSGEKITDAGSQKIQSAINAMIDGAKSTINKRKGEFQSELSKMFNEKGGIGTDEQAVLDEANKASDEKLAKIDEIQKKISDVWTKAIQEHGKLSQEDVQQIESYLQQVQQIQAEVSAKNTAESDFAKNQFSERLTGISSEDARKEYQSASEDLSKNFANARATYKTGMDDLQKMIDEANTKGDTAAAERNKKVLDDKKKEYDDLISTERTKRREYLNMLYEKNPSLEGNLNEVDGTMFSKADRNTQGNLYKLKQQYSEVANATESGMKRVKDANGQWHDIEVTVDQATGNITSAYDTFTGDYGGYSKKFADDAKATGDKIREAMENLQKALMPNGGGIKLDSNNNAVNAATDQIIEKLDNVTKKADGTRVAVQNINGTKIRLEFDENGTLKNAQDVEDAINGKFKDNPAVVQTKVTIDGQEADSTSEDIIKKLKDIKESNPNAKISINGEEIPTIDEAIEKLGKVPPDTNTDVVVETGDANSKIDETSQKADDLNSKKPDIETSTNADDTAEKVDNLTNKANLVPKYHPTVFEAIFKGWETLKQYLPFIGEVSVFNKKSADSNYTGTNSPQTGLSYVNEHGYETAKGSNVKMINSGLAYISSHAVGGDGINDHMTTVNEMQNDINNSVNNKLGATVAKLLSSTGNTLQELKKITQNTGQSADAGIKNIELNEKLANNLVNAFNSSSTNGSFSSLNTELEMANTAKDKASKMKVDDNTNYASLKNQVDSIKADIDDLDTTIDNTTDESTKKQLEAQKKVLKAKQDSVEKEMDLAKMVAENEIQNAKDSADQQVKIAEEKKDKLTKIAEAVTTAIENQLKAEDAAAEKTINNKLTKLESNYNKKLAALEEESTQTSRSDTLQGYNDQIAKLENMKSNSASYADQQAYQKQIDNIKKEMNKTQDEWNTDDKKKALEEEYNKQKDTLEKQLKDTKDYYSKLEETDSVNAQARYILLNGSNQDLVDLLNSYNPQWQNAGQSLTDSLLTGLNSNKQTIQEAVGELVQIRSGKEYGSDSDSGTYTYYDTATQTTKIGHYATGTNSNPRSGLYYTNENDFEMSSKGDVAYVSQGAAIKNHMQTQAYIDSLVATEVSNLKASLIQSQQDTIRSMFSGFSGGNNSVVNKEGNNVIFQVENYNQYTNSDIEATANALGYYAFKEQRN
ncbi:phage tail tape measure protein [Clostridium beijerinckii]|nr:phage tail tape measure protein [Clostridium beijerinckii]MZK61768.1 phage tail tape measure protein [Clostridium beijerinckii]MZK71967.1 phage tail tape measure protein [Clostridium beijerinckii]MZK86938.1 phage tail tape measure protein [Clostridium beijerinckii]MZL11194.1 phage tail tape measure protein [Clostridium beijerinckii]